MEGKYHCFIMSILVFICSMISVEKSFSGEEKQQNYNFWAPKDPPRAYYRFDCAIDPEARSLNGSGYIRLTNNTKHPICRLAIDWAMNDHQTIDIQSDGKPVRILGGQKDVLISPLVIELPQYLPPDKELELMLNFSMRDSLPVLTELTVVTDSTVDRISMSRFLPTIWWGFSSSDDYDVKIDIPPDYIIATSGRFDRKTGYYKGEFIRNFGLFIGKGYNVMEADAGGTLICCYYNDQSKKPTQIILETAVDAILFFRDYFGFYPYKHLNFVPGSAVYWGGFNTATSIASIHSMERFSPDQKSHWRTITVHEIGHMYWGEYVMEKDSPDWLWLGLGIYTQREYDRFKRSEPNSPKGYLTRFSDAIKQYYDTTIEVPPHHLRKMESYFNGVVQHGKGYSIISTLHCILGHETFDRIIRRCLKEFAGRRLGASEFQNISEQESQQDLVWFFDPWLRSNTFPSYQISSQECQENNKHFVSEIIVDCSGNLKMPVPVAAFFVDGSSQLKFTDRMLDQNVLIFESDSPLKNVIIDPDHLTALVDPPPSGDFDLLVELSKEIQAIPWTGANEKAFILYREATNTGLKSTDQWYKLGMILYDGTYYAEALKAFDYALEFNDDDPYIPFIVYYWKGHLFDLLDKREEALDFYKKALNVYPGHPVIHSQYNMEIDEKWLEERLQIPFHR